MSPPPLMLFALGSGLFLFYWLLKRSFQTQTSEQYFVSDRKTALFPLVATLVMTELNTSTLLGFASMGYIFGSSASLLALVFLIGLLFYAVSVAKKWKQFDGITVTTFFEKRYNPTIGYIVSYILVLTMLGFSANFLKSLVFIFQPLFPGINPWILSGIFCILMTLLTIRGGLKAIIQMDKVSFLITLAIVPLLLIFSWSHEPVISRATEARGYPLEFVVSLTIITMFTYILAPWYGQKIFSAKNKHIAYQATIWSAFLVAGFYGVAILAASCVSTTELADPETVIPYIIYAYFPPIFKMVAYFVLFLIAATTIVGLWNTIASVLLAQRTMNRKSLSQSIHMTKGVTLVSYLGANLFVDKILDKLILTNIPIAALSFSLLGGFYWRRVSSVACLASLVTGTVGGITSYFYFGDPEYLWYWALYVIPLHFVVGMGATFLFPNAKPLVAQLSV